MAGGGLSFTFGALGIALLLSPGAWVALGVLLGAVAAVVARRLPRVRAEFAVAELTATASVGVLVTHATEGSAGSLGAAIIGIAAAWLVRHTLVAAAVAFTSRRSIFQVFAGGAPASLLHTAGNAATGMLAGWLAVCAPLGLLGLVVPLLLLWSMFELQARQSAEADMFAELVRGQEQASGRSVDVSAQIVVTAVARVLGGADVELIVNGVDGPMRYAGDESGTPDRRRVSPDVFDEPWVMRLLGGSRVLTGEEEGRPFCAALVGQWRAAPRRACGATAARFCPVRAAGGDAGALARASGGAVACVAGRGRRGSRRGGPNTAARPVARHAHCPGAGAPARVLAAARAARRRDRAGHGPGRRAARAPGRGARRRARRRIADRRCGAGGGHATSRRRRGRRPSCLPGGPPASWRRCPPVRCGRSVGTSPDRAAPTRRTSTFRPRERPGDGASRPDRPAWTTTGTQP